MQLNKKTFLELFKIARHQFVLESEKYVYFIPIKEEVHCSDSSFLAHNETLGNVEIVDYETIIKGVVDGKKYSFRNPA
ncbi:MAG: hypothetical protein ABIJ16_14385 [Bacteroidota bacterium]